MIILYIYIYVALGSRPMPGKNNGDRKMTRYFKFRKEGGEFSGRVSGTTPEQAAKKALTSILRRDGFEPNSDSQIIEFEIMEWTRGSTHTIYYYTGQRRLLDTPVERILEERTIICKYGNHVEKRCPYANMKHARH